MKNHAPKEYEYEFWKYPPERMLKVIADHCRGCDPKGFVFPMSSIQGQGSYVVQLVEAIIELEDTGSRARCEYCKHKAVNLLGGGWCYEFYDFKPGCQRFKSVTR